MKIVNNSLQTNKKILLQKRNAKVVVKYFNKIYNL